MADERKAMRIVELRAENVKRLKAVNVKPDGSTVIVGGNNGQGKTSLLDSIAYALGGAKLCPEKPIRDGEKKAMVQIDLGEMTVKRTWTEKGTYLTIEIAGGAKLANPQEVLDRMNGSLCFDPLAFSRMDRAKQRKVLTDLVGLDFSAIDQRRKMAYEERTFLSRTLKDKKARLTGMPEVDVPEGEVSVDALMAEIEKRETHNRKMDNLKTVAADCDDAIAQLGEEIGELLRRTEEAKKRIEGLEKRREEHKTELALMFPAMDVQEIRNQVRKASEINAAIGQMRKRTELAAEVKMLETNIENGTRAIETADMEKQKALSDAKFPVPGLAFDETSVLFNGIPFDQAADSEKLRVSVAMGLAMNPQLRVMLIRDGSLLDEKSMQIIGEMAEQADAQVWIERVGEGKECSVILEEGEIKSRKKSEKKAATLFNEPKED